MRALLAAAAAAAVSGQCSVYTSCRACAGSASCNWCQVPQLYDATGVCQSVSLTSCASSSSALYSQASACPSQSAS